ncbi:MAG: amidohydrolase family protein, partial [Lacisediminihabitans sp.]
QSSNSLPETLRLVALERAEIAGVVGWVDLAAQLEPQLGQIENVSRRPLVGVRHLVHIDPDPEWLARPDVSRGLTELAEHGLAYDLVLRPSQLAMAAEVASAHPELRFVLDHLGGAPVGEDLGEWRAGISALAAESNVVAKVSGIASGLRPGQWSVEDVRAVFGIALDSFGPDRLLYGSDWPLVELGGGAKRWREAVDELANGLSSAERNALFSDNAREAYRLG